MSKVDWWWRWFIVTKIYCKGWGNPDDMKRIMMLRKRLGNRESFTGLLPADYPVYIDKEVQKADYRLLDGHFRSPVNDHCPDIMPKEVEIARFQMLLPNEWNTNLRPMCVHMGGTGDHGFGRRRRLVCEPLLKEEGIASLILENPYYGSRKPKDQFRSSLQYVSDLFVMGAGLIMEGNVLFNWLDKQGYGPLGATGISMGGHMASLAATNWHKPISLIPCMSGSTAAGTFTDGVLSTAIPWKILKQQYKDIDAYSEDITDLIESPEPYWNNGNSVYCEGRRFFHKLENESQYYTSASGDKFKPVSICDNPGLDESVSSSHCDSMSVSSTSESEICVNQPDNESTNVHQSNVCDKTTSSDDSSSSSLYNWVGNITNSLPALPDIFSSSKSTNSDEDKIPEELERKCKHFMKGVMDECTHLGNFSVPVDPELIIIVIAENDAYIPHSGYLKLVDLWPGSQLRSIPCGHVVGFIDSRYRREFRKAIGDSFEIHAKKYYNTQMRQTS